MNFILLRRCRLTKTKVNSIETSIKIFIVISALVGLGMGFSDAILANYFKDAYDVNAQQRGFIEFPRELPGVLSVFFIAALSFLKSKKTAIVAQLLTVFGLLALGLFRPSFSIMLIFLFIYSTGVHMYLTLGDSIGLSLAKAHTMGKMMGKFNSIRMAFLMLSGIITFVGFKSGYFSFDAPVIVFILGALAFALATLLLVALCKRDTNNNETANSKLVFRKEYLRYYAICALFGGRKQIMLVYSPWVLIELLDFKADTMSILAVIGSFIGIFFMPIVGKWIDQIGVKKVMTIEALAFIVVYVAYGFLSKWVSTNEVLLSGIVMILVYLLNIIDRMSAQFAMVRSIYMRTIAIAPEDVTPSLSLGMSIDHVVAIIGSYICGVIWYNWGPEYVFIIAGIMSFMNLLIAKGIKLDNVESK